MNFVFVLHHSLTCQRTSRFHPCFCDYRWSTACWCKIIDCLYFMEMMNLFWRESLLCSSNQLIELMEHGISLSNAAHWANQTLVKCTLLVMAHLRMKRVQICISKQKNAVRTRLSAHNLKEKYFAVDHKIWLTSTHKYCMRAGSYYALLNRWQHNAAWCFCD